MRVLVIGVVALVGIIFGVIFLYDADQRSDTGEASATQEFSDGGDESGQGGGHLVSPASEKLAEESLSASLGEQSIYDFQSTRDHSEAWNDLLARAENGDPEAARGVWKIHEECLFYLQRRTDVEIFISQAAQSNQSVQPGMLSRAFGELESRCGGLSAEDVTHEGLVQHLELAASLGDPAAQLELYLRDPEPVDGMDEALLQSMFEDLAFRGDAEAYIAASVAAARIQAGALGENIPTGTVSAELAWTLAACRSGMRCDSFSPYVRQMCFGGGINCELLDVESFYSRYALSPAEMEKARQQMDLILRSGRD